jgi:hypothetical protein
VLGLHLGVMECSSAFEHPAVKGMHGAWHQCWEAGVWWLGLRHVLCVHVCVCVRVCSLHACDAPAALQHVRCIHMSGRTEQGMHTCAWRPSHLCYVRRHRCSMPATDGVMLLCALHSRLDSRCGTSGCGLPLALCIFPLTLVASLKRTWTK